MTCHPRVSQHGRSLLAIGIMRCPRVRKVAQVAAATPVASLQAADLVTREEHVESCRIR